MKKANLETAEALANRFYSSYPWKTAAEKRKLTQTKGFFDELKCVVALGFSRDSIHDVLGFFTWKKDILSIIQKKEIKSGKPSADYKLDCVAYLFELAYELLLDADLDISENPGFESLVGLWSN